jgi:large subunit ribosomal protein L35
MKTKRAAKKRYRITGSGLVKVGKKGKRHLASSKSRKRKRHLKHARILGPRDTAMALSLLPNG